MFSNHSRHHGCIAGLFTLAAVLVLTGGRVEQAGAADFYVAPNGNDANPGTLAAPFATLQAACTASRSAGKSVQKRIILRGGNYYNATLFLDAYYDGNLTLMPYPGETPILFGGQPLTSWVSAGSNNCYVARLPAFPTSVTTTVSQLTRWEPRVLLADGQMCLRARLPAVGKFHYVSLSGTTLTYTNIFPATTNMELVIDRSWSDAEVLATAINTGAKTITLNTSISMGPNTADVRSFAVVNLPEGMTQDNQFWWNKTNNTIVFRPPAGKDPNTMSIIVPTTTRILFLRGWSASGPLTNIVVTNLTLCGVNVPIGTGGQDDFGEYYSAAIACTYTTNCVIDSCTVFGVGGQGIGIDNYQNNFRMTVRNCIVHDCGSGGICFPWTTDCVISNNAVYNTGLICQAGPGIRGSSNGSTLITQNTITNCSGTGINVQSGVHSTITSNILIRCVKTLRDMGGIYVWGGSDQVISGNYVAEINGTNSDNGGPWDPFLFGIYCDMGTTRPTVNGNITYNCTRPFIYHMSTNGTYLNNLFVNTRSEDTIINFHNSDTSVIFQHNILASSRRAIVNAENSTYIPYSLNENLAVADWHYNMFWSYAGLNTGYPTNAIAADPLLQRLLPLNPGFQTPSPAPGLGIRPLSVASMGRRLSGPTELHILPP